MRAASFEKVSFSGHETFPLRYTWLPKAVREVSEDPRIFAREDAMVQLGVGSNMVRAIRHWGLVSGMLSENPADRGHKTSVSDFGQRLLGANGWDPYLEDPATLWLIHWRIASVPSRATTWYWVFSHCPQPEFNKDELLRWLKALIEQRGATRTSDASLKRDIDCFIGTYVQARADKRTPIEDTLDCPLGELGLIREFGSKGTYLLQRAPQPTLPDEVFAFALAEFLARNDASAKTLALDEIAYAPGSPGRVFCLSEEALLTRLERLGAVTYKGMVFDETAGLRQLLIREIPDRNAVLARHYKANNSTHLS